LRHCLERASLLSPSACFETEALFGTDMTLNAPSDSIAERQPLGDYLQICERDYIHRTLTECSGRITEAASRLGISRKNLWQKMRKLSLKEESADQVDLETSHLPQQ
jgi:DNA-binding NtrC family response regulator